MNHEIRISNMYFDPAELVIGSGDTVTWTNDDGIPHSATADNGSFDTGPLRPGDTSDPITLTTPGYHAPYHCKFHTDMHGSIRVE